MPLNVPGILVPLQLLLYPRLVTPNLLVKDIRQIDFPALKRAGYRGAVFDKDNCLTIPHQDTLVPELQDAWKQCKDTFGEGNVLIVSNSAGTWLDAGGIQSESVTYHLGVPVLFHQQFKPAYSCISAIRLYFSTLRTPIQDNELIIVGDRIFTDVVLANRIRMQHMKAKASIRPPTSVAEKNGPTSTVQAQENVRRPPGPLSIWTTGVWKKESMLMRWLERRLVDAVERWSTPPPKVEFIDVERFVKEIVKPDIPKKPGLKDNMFALFKKS